MFVISPESKKEQKSRYMKKMKKSSYIILSLLLLITLFTGCAKSDGLSIKVCGYSDSLPENPHKLEYREWSKDTFTDSKANKSVALSFGSLEAAGEYVKTDIKLSEFYKTHEYKDANNRYFSLTEDGKLCSYFFGKGAEEENVRVYTESECIDIARAFVANITDISEYTVTAAFDEGQKMYTVSFTKYADGFECADRADVSVEETGHIYSFSSTMFGRIPADAKTDFDREAVQAQVIAKLDTEYSKAKQVYDEVSYKNFDYELTVDEDGEYALVCSADVVCVDHGGGYDEVISERIILLIRQ